MTYYGGKQRLAERIIALFPEHSLYCEPFIGGGAVFFNKPPSKVEVINDVNSELINFYEVVKRDFVSLEKEVAISLHSRVMHRHAKTIYQNPDMFDKIKRAWAVWYLAGTSFAAKLNGAYGYGVVSSEPERLRAKRESFTEELAIRLQDAQIECTDALRIIRSRDTASSLFYCDPPYPGTDMGHYDGYTFEDYEMLLRTLSEIKGNFILSSYKNEPLTRFTKKHGWSCLTIDVPLLGKKAKGMKRERRRELLTANFEILEL